MVITVLCWYVRSQTCNNNNLLRRELTIVSNPDPETDCLTEGSHCTDVQYSTVAGRDGATAAIDRVTIKRGIYNRRSLNPINVQRCNQRGCLPVSVRFRIDRLGNARRPSGGPRLRHIRGIVASAARITIYSLKTHTRYVRYRSVAHMPRGSFTRFLSTQRSHPSFLSSLFSNRSQAPGQHEAAQPNTRRTALDLQWRRSTASRQAEIRPSAIP